MAEPGVDGQWLPTGWTLQRVREVAQAPNAGWGDPSTPAVWEGETEPVEITTVLTFGDLVVVLEAKSASWVMGQIHEGAIVLWGDYDDDLERALKGL